ncbi:MAG: hypothetical protein PHP54_02935 [Clostridia bacterium]|nr:hypothetical protein [Clostridia bacterium]
MFKREVIEILGDKMCYYEQGQGKVTCVFSSGLGIPFPLADMYELANKLSTNCRCVIIDRFGYGNSDIVSKKRTIENITSETIELFEKINIQAENTIFIGHSIASLHALSLAQKLNLKGVVLIDNENMNTLPRLISNILNYVYYLFRNTRMKMKYDMRLVNLLFENRKIPKYLKDEGKKIIVNKLPNYDQLDELKNMRKDKNLLESSLKESNINNGLLICKESSKKNNQLLQKYFKKSKLINTGKTSHFIHYEKNNLLYAEIINYFELYNNVIAL